MWRLIVTGAAALMIVSGAVAQKSQELQTRTRFGVLTLDQQDRLVFRGHRLEPPIEPGTGMDLSEPFRIGQTDVVLVTKIGGTACPFRYYFVRATDSGAKASPAFGTCNEATSVKRVGNRISLTMHGFLGPFEPEAQRRKAFQQSHVFVFQDGAVTENGKPIE